MEQIKETVVLDNKEVTKDELQEAKKQDTPTQKILEVNPGTFKTLKRLQE